MSSLLLVFITVTAFWANLRYRASQDAAIEDRSLERDNLLHGSSNESHQLLIVSREDPTVVLFSTHLLCRKLFAETMMEAGSKQ